MQTKTYSTTLKGGTKIYHKGSKKKMFFIIYLFINKYNIRHTKCNLWNTAIIM